ncbi:putative membrane protein [Salsuginibacillus halophilus]|uniref:Putative membrane protein n=1 Tax=Salsuginibacillus halophilus TaxID=517424 RepID=A0A2P8HXG4_9BACI|nr:DMT family transporter [Salsuginibacillus halophilus]PSL50921.1 putative membrane protein [Salsuginibacillus halophilus]
MGILLALGTAAGFAFSNIFIRLGMRKSPEDNGVFMTLIINILMMVTALLTYRLLFTAVEVTLVGVGWFVLAGFFTTFIGRVTLFRSFRDIGPTRGTAIKNSAPMFTIFFAVLLFQEELELLPMTGALLVMAGLLIQGWFMVRNATTAEGNGAAERRGYVIALVSAAAFGFGQTMRSPGMEVMPDPFLGALISAFVALSAFLILEARHTSVTKQLKFQMKNKNPFYMLAGLGTGTAMICFFAALQFTPVSYVSVVAALEPLLTIILARLILKETEPIYRYTIISALTVTAGIMWLVLST